MKTKSITYWTTTILVAFFMSGGIAQVLRLPPTIDGFHRVLGYPVYFVVILGVWKILGAIAILVPGLPRLKEWAYAGIFFDLTGAAVTNAAAADYGAYAFHIIAPLVITVLLIASWALRPPSRILGTPSL
jgi:uncharacterized membrane protein YphA (DoxX/SURF4 family)